MGRLKSCPYCGRIHDRQYDCGKRPVYKRRTIQDKYRDTYAWQCKRKEINERDYFLCRYCLLSGNITVNNLSVHHIEPLKERPDLQDDDDNLITLCDICHKKAEAGLINRNLLHLLTQSPPYMHRRKTNERPHRPPTFVKERFRK